MGRVLLADTNSFQENGLVYSPDAEAVIKDNTVYDIDLGAIHDAATGDYMTPIDPANLSLGYETLDEVLVNSADQVLKADETALIRSAADGASIAYTVNSDA